MHLKRSTKNVKYDLKTGQLMLDNFTSRDKIEEESPALLQNNRIVEEAENAEDAKFEESKSESN